jgi:putative DNA primase/helicase
LSEEDSIGQWIEECCDMGKEQWGVGTCLWDSWKAWAESNKEPVGTRRAFAEAMTAHGFAKDKRQGKRGYSGIDLKPGGCTRADLD